MKRCACLNEVVVTTHYPRILTSYIPTRCRLLAARPPLNVVGSAISAAARSRAALDSGVCSNSHNHQTDVITRVQQDISTSVLPAPAPAAAAATVAVAVSSRPLLGPEVRAPRPILPSLPCGTGGYPSCQLDAAPPPSASSASSTDAAPCKQGTDRLPLVRN